MNNILLVTPLYPLPTPENNCTYVCHFFTREWVRMGYRVVVIHQQPVHCRAWHLLVKYFGKQLLNLAGGGNFYARRIRQTEHYVMDGVPVYRVPIYNFIPHGRYPKRSVEAFRKEVDRILDEIGFRPDCIVGHAGELEIIPTLNQRYGAKTAMVSHGIPKKIRRRYPDCDEWIRSYDAWGFRAKPIREEFERLFPAPRKAFWCWSGIPESYLCEQNAHASGAFGDRYLFVGDLIERKYPITLLQAIPEQAGPDYSITFIGTGPEEDRLRAFARSNGIRERVRFLGQVTRDEIPAFFDRTDCFIMVSRAEAYGLVYLEAMARGCLVVASRGEGFDGIIVDGENGFLCGAGDAEELAAVLGRIRGMSDGQRAAISEKAVRTAREMTDRKMAERYIHQLEEL